MPNKIVSQEDWLKAREDLLVAEKETVRRRDAMAAQRRRMPWMAVEKDYVFEGPHAVLAKLNPEAKRRLGAFLSNLRSFDRDVYDLIERHHIDCHPVRKGWLQVRYTDAGVPALHQRAQQVLKTRFKLIDRNHGE